MDHQQSPVFVNFFVLLLIPTPAKEPHFRPSPTLLHELFAHKGLTLDPAYSPDSNWLASASNDGSTIVWRASTVTWADVLCKLLDHNLSQDQWKRYFRDEPYCFACPGLPKGI